MKQSVVQAVLNAVSNSSVRPIGPDNAAAILKTGDGPGAQVRALFGDCSADTILRYAIEIGLDNAGLRSAFKTAQTKHAVANVDLEEALSI